MTESDDAGETLVEILITMVIMSVAILAIVGGILMAMGTSHLHRQQAQAQTLLRSWAETVNAGGYVDCGSPSPAVPGPPALPAGISANAPQVDCVSGADGLTKVSLGLTVDTGLMPGFTQMLYVIVRKPCESGC